jgi:alpha-beta hydrolase superfamily lysophospholipase
MFQSTYIPVTADSDSLLARDGTRLALHRWPGSGDRGTVLIVHGLGEHGGRYAHVAAWLAERGFRCLGYDHRGHGRSAGARGVLPDGAALRDDLGTVVDALRPRDEPFLLLGHSMGGAVVADFVARRVRAADLVILSSPALRARLSAFQRLQLALGLRLMPDLALGNGLDPQAIAHDPATVRAYMEDPLVHDRVSARLAKAILDAGESAIAAAPKWDTATLLLYGGADRIVDPSGSATFAASAPREVVEAQRFDALYHEILNEGTLAAPVFARLEQWLDARLPRRPR